MLLSLIVIVGAAFGQASPQAAFLFSPDLLTRDIPVVIEVMDLDADQAAVLDTLIQEYLSSFDLAHKQAMAELEALDAGSLRGNWQADDWSEWRDAWASVREKAISIDNPAAAAAWLATQREWARRELVTLVANRPEALPSARTVVLEDWLNTRRSLREGFERDVSLVLEPSEVDRWTMVEAAIRRQRTVFGQMLEGEQFDLGSIIGDVLVSDPSMLARLEPSLDAYEAAWSAAAASRDRVLEELLPRRLDAEERRDRVSLLHLIARETEARQALVKVNVDWYERFSGLMPTDRINDFQRRVNDAWYPDIFLPSQPQRIVAHLLATEDLSKAMRADLIASRIKYGGPRLQIAAKEREARRGSLGRRLTGRSEQQAMAEVFGPTALFRLNRLEADEMLAEASVLANRRQETDISWLRSLYQQLGPDQWDSIPDAVRLPPEVIRRTLLGDDGEPLQFRAVP
jgi:hypothetical protein